MLCIGLYNEENDWTVEAIDIKAAFLEADLEENEFIEWPEGLVEFGYMTSEEQEDKCIQLGKAMYGCVQSPLAFFNELLKQLRKMGMKQCKSDPCIWYKRDGDKLILIVAVYVDDCVLAGKKKDIEIFKVEIQGRFNIQTWERSRNTSEFGMRSSVMLMAHIMSCP